jgi:hypothetical protein
VSPAPSDSPRLDESPPLNWRSAISSRLPAVACSLRGAFDAPLHELQRRCTVQDAQVNLAMPQPRRTRGTRFTSRDRTAQVLRASPKAIPLGSRAS